jgi:Bacterial Ig domain/Calcineurin-like phosphoesterase
MKNIYRFLFLGVIVLVLISAPMSSMVQRVSAAPANCADSSPSAAYTVRVCITVPASGATFTGNGTITGTATVLNGINPGVEQMIFYMDSTYLLTAFAGPNYTFTLPTNRYLDGTYTLYTQALMRDGFTTAQASITLILSTGTINLPVNTNTFTPKTGNPANGQPFVAAVVGDGASGEVNATNVTNLIASVNPNLFLYLGDVYEQGSIAEFYNWYGTGTFFGQFRSITDPTVGHHEYLSDANASPYFYYWDNVPNYYSVNTNGWHIISLNSHGAAGGTSSVEYIWLQSDLAANKGACTIAYYHNPLYSIGNEVPDLSMTSILQLLASNKASIVLNGNDHDYER